MKKWMLILTAFIGVLLSSIVFAVQQNWTSWVADVRKEALDQGISEAVFDAAFADIHEPSRQVKGLARSQPEHRLTYSKYLSSRVDKYRIDIGKREYKKNKVLLDEIANHYGVDPCFILSFWGMESSLVHF